MSGEEEGIPDRRMTPRERLLWALVDRECAAYCGYCGVWLVMPPLVEMHYAAKYLGEAPIGYHLTLVPRVRVPHVDHIIPRSKGGTDDLDNLVLACAPCNLEKSDMDAREFMARKIAIYDATGRM